MSSKLLRITHIFSYQVEVIKKEENAGKQDIKRRKNLVDKLFRLIGGKRKTRNKRKNKCKYNSGIVL